VTPSLFAQVAVNDAPGWGAAEWLAVASVTVMLLAAGLGFLGTWLKLRSVKANTEELQTGQTELRAENSTQHGEGRALVATVGDRLLDLHTMTERVNTKLDALAEKFDAHMTDISMHVARVAQHDTVVDVHNEAQDARDIARDAVAG
jgi:hypothetical protein